VSAMSADELPGARTSPDRLDIALVHVLPDRFLMTLVELVNDAGELEIGMTLHVSGVIVSGLLISDRRYFELLNEAVQPGGSQESAGLREALGDALTDQAESDRAAEFSTETDSEQAALELFLTSYIHMRNAEVHAPGGPGRLAPALWRGRLSHVSGWSVGVLGGRPGA
jgi:hypothetical protein